MTDFTFVPAGEQDAPALLALCRAAAAAAPSSHWDEDYPDEAILRYDIEQEALYRIAGQNGETLGMISLGELDLKAEPLPWPDRDETAAEAARFCLAPEYQGQGLGVPTVRAAAELCFDRGCESLRFLAAADDARLLGMYKKCGAQDVGRAHLWGCDYAMLLLTPDSL